MTCMWNQKSFTIWNTLCESAGMYERIQVSSKFPIYTNKCWLTLWQFFHNLLCTVRDNKCQKLIAYLESSHEPKSGSAVNLHHTFSKIDESINIPNLLFTTCKVTSYHFLSWVLPWPQSSLVLVQFLEWSSEMCSSSILGTGKLWGTSFQVLCCYGIIPTAACLS